MVHPRWYRVVVAETVVVVAETVVVVAETVVVVAETVVVVAETEMMVTETVVVVAETVVVVAETEMMVTETEEGKVAQAGVTVQPFPATLFPPVLTARKFRRNSGKMNSQRPRSPQNRVPQPVPEIFPSIATLIHPESSGFSFYSR